MILLGCVFGAVSAQSTGYSAVFDDYSILTVNFWSRALVRMAAVTIQLGVMKPVLRVSTQPTDRPYIPLSVGPCLKLMYILGNAETNLDWDLQLVRNGKLFWKSTYYRNQKRSLISICQTPSTIIHLKKIKLNKFVIY